MPTTNKTKTENAIAMLKSDHQKVKELFHNFEDIPLRRRKLSLVLCRNSKSTPQSKRSCSIRH
jgi:hypothetical protein